MATPGPTRIHIVVDELITLFSDATGLQVIDAPHIGELMDEAICVGLTEPDRPGYQVAVNRQDGFGRPRLREDFTVRNLLTISSGDTDMKALRSRAADLLGVVDAALRDHAVMDGAWDRAALGADGDWIPVQHEGGATVNVFFTVEGSSLL